MLTKENTVYLAYANVLFDYFRDGGMKEGEGGFLMHTMRSRYGGINQTEYLDYLYKICYNLCVNGFLNPSMDGDSVSLDGFIKLTQAGADYIQGGPLIVNKVDFNQYIFSTDDVRKQFDDLWLLIGDETKAPFYIKGSTYLNMIRPYITDYLPGYMDFIEDRRQHEKPTSRRIWYRELFLKINTDKITSFLTDLSYAVSLCFYYAEEVDEDYLELFNQREEDIDTEVSQAVPELPELQIDESNQKQSPDELLAISLEICNSFKRLVEDNRLYKLLYNDDNTPKNETAAQLLFYSVAKGYCSKYDVDINRESDPGIGELDFKFSVGNKSKVVIEMKLSTNTTLQHGFNMQLPAYLRAEEAPYGILLVIQLNKTIEPQLEKVKESYAQLKDSPGNSIYLICVDATPKPSASRI